MSGDESFLARWSRRKRNVAAQADAEKDPPPSAAEIAKTGSPTTGEAPPPIPLPPIESIASGSDITAFPSQPPDLRSPSRQSLGIGVGDGIAVLRQWRPRGGIGQPREDCDGTPKKFGPL